MPQNQSFLPEDYVEKKIARRTNLICISLFAIVLVAVVAAFYVTDRQRGEVRDQLAQLNSQFESKAMQIKQIEQLQSQKQAMMNKARVTAQLVEKVPRPLLLSELINHMPTPLSLTSFELETKLIKPSPARTALQKAKKDKANKNAKDKPQLDVPDREATVTLVGVSPAHKDISDYQTKLTTNPLFAEVNLGGIEATKVEGRDMLEFKLILKLNAEIDAQQIEPTRVARSIKRDPLSSDKLGLTPDGGFAAPPTADAPTP